MIIIDYALLYVFQSAIPEEIKKENRFPNNNCHFR